MISNHQERILSPEHLGLGQVKAEAIFGGDTVAEAANIFMDVLNGNGSKAQNEVVCANAGLAIATASKTDLKPSVERAMESLKSGAALEKFKKLQDLSKSA